jgi:hypothetical protein
MSLGGGPQGWGFYTRLITLLCKKTVIAKTKEVKPGSNVVEFSKEGYGSKWAVLPMMMTMMIRIKEISDVSRSSQVQNQTTPK